jgi:hypothetical protein
MSTTNGVLSVERLSRNTGDLPLWTTIFAASLCQTTRRNNAEAAMFQELEFDGIPNVFADPDEYQSMIEATSLQESRYPDKGNAEAKQAYTAGVEKALQQLFYQAMITHTDDELRSAILKGVPNKQVANAGTKAFIIATSLVTFNSEITKARALAECFKSIQTIADNPNDTATIITRLLGLSCKVGETTNIKTDRLLAIAIADMLGSSPNGSRTAAQIAEKIQASDTIMLPDVQRMIAASQQQGHKLGTALDTNATSFSAIATSPKVAASVREGTTIPKGQNRAICDHCGIDAGGPDSKHSAMTCQVDSDHPDFVYGKKHTFTYKGERNYHRAKRDYSPRPDRNTSRGGIARSGRDKGDPFNNVDTTAYHDKAHYAIDNEQEGFEHKGKDYWVEKNDNGNVYISTKI